MDLYRVPLSSEHRSKFTAKVNMHNDFQSFTKIEPKVSEIDIPEFLASLGIRQPQQVLNANGVNEQVLFQYRDFIRAQFICDCTISRHFKGRPPLNLC